MNTLIYVCIYLIINQLIYLGELAVTIKFETIESLKQQNSNSFRSSIEQKKIVYEKTEGEEVESEKTEDEEFKRAKIVSVAIEKSASAKCSSLSNFWKKHSRFIILILCWLSVALCCYLQGGWSDLQLILYKSGAFETYCNTSNKSTNVLINNVNYTDCDERKSSMNNLFTTGIGSQLIFLCLTGLAFDIIGAKLTILSSLFLLFTAWVMFAYANFVSPNISSFMYYGHAILLGVVVHPLLMGFMSVCDLFKGKEGRILSFVGSGASFSFGVPFILSRIYISSFLTVKDIDKVCWGYILIGLGVPFLVTLLFIPRSGFGEVKKDSKENEEIAETPTEETEISKKKKPLLIEESIKKCLLHPEYWLILIHFCINLFRAEFFAKSNRDQLKTTSGQQAYALFSLFNVLGFIPCNLIGFFSDKLSPIYISLIVNLAGTLAYIFLMFNNYACKILAALFFSIFFSYLISDVMLYVKAKFPRCYMGKLYGCICTAAGALAFLSMPIYRWSLTASFLYADSLMIVGGIINGFIIWYISCSERKRINKKSKMKLEAT